MTPSEKQFPQQNDKPFKTDSEKLVSEHLADPNHVITEEDMQKIRIGVTPPADEPTQQAVADAESKVADHKADNEDDTTPGAQKVTSWDVVE